MPLYAYKATDPSGKITKGTTEAVDEKGVAVFLQAKGLIPIQISTAGKTPGKFNRILSQDPLLFLSRIKTKDVLMFTQDLSTLLAAGLPVDRALSILVNVTENDKFREVVHDVLKSIQGGSDLSTALAKYPKVFTKFYVNMIRAGEAGGVQDAVLERLGGFLEMTQELKDHIRSALVYPAFLVSVSGISIIILMIYVIPRFSQIFADMGDAIPLSTRLLLVCSELFTNYWWGVLLVIFTGVTAVWRYAGTEAGRLKVDSWSVRLPVIGDLVKSIEVGRFARTLGTLVTSGVPILQALELVKDVLSNRVIAGAIGIVHDRVKEGEKLSRPLADSGVFPPLAIQIITVGEETGKMSEMLFRVADNYEKNVRNMVSRFISLLEPALILVMGVVVGFIVISMLMGIFSVNDMPF
jgi:general secretion pathway protein F